LSFEIFTHLPGEIDLIVYLFNISSSVKGKKEAMEGGFEERPGRQMVEPDQPKDIGLDWNPVL